MKDDIIRGNGSTGIKSKLGYLLSGPVYGTKPHTQDCFWNDDPANPNGEIVNFRFRSVLLWACFPLILNAILIKHLKESMCICTPKLTKYLYIGIIILRLAQRGNGFFLQSDLIYICPG